MALTNEQERALALLREGLSTAEVAQRLGLSRPTVWRWQNELPEFAATAPANSGPERGPLTRPELARVVVTLVAVLLAVLFLYLGYWA